MGAASPPVARKVDVCDSFFDDFFNEDSQFGNSAELLKPSLIETVRIARPPCLDIDNSLDAFLNATLKADTQPARETVSDCPPSLDSSQIIQTSSANDPFADWP